MPEKHPFIVEQFEDDPDAVIPEDVLRPIEQDNNDSILKQIVDNAKVSVSTTEVKIQTHGTF